MVHIELKDLERTATNAGVGIREFLEPKMSMLLLLISCHTGYMSHKMGYRKSCYTSASRYFEAGATVDPEAIWPLGLLPQYRREMQGCLCKDYTRDPKTAPVCASLVKSCDGILTYCLEWKCSRIVVKARENMLEFWGLAASGFRFVSLQGWTCLHHSLFR